MASSPTPQPATSHFDVVVVGAGQAGLAVGYFLARQRLQFVILEAGSQLGSAWRGRWDSLKLFTSRRYSGLPGLPFPGNPDWYAGRDEVAQYLERYAREFSLPVELNGPVRELATEDGRFRIEVDGRTLTADQVVVATGAFQTPYVPPFADQAGARGRADAQHRVRAHRRHPRRRRPRGRGRQHGLPDRRRACTRAGGRPSLGRLPAGAVAAAPARTRHLLVAVSPRGVQQDDRDANRTAAEGAVAAHRLKPRRSRKSASRCICERPARPANDHVQRRKHARRGRRDLGDGLPKRLLVDQGRDHR